MAIFLSIILALIFVAGVSAQSVLPSNASIPAPRSGVNLALLLSDGHRAKRDRFEVTPLTSEAGLDATAPALQAFQITGVLRNVDAETANSVSNRNLAFISCDSDGSGIGPSRIVQTAAANKPAAIILYSTESASCNLNGSFGYGSLYSTTSIVDSTFIQMLIAMSSAVGAKIAVNSSDTPPPPFGSNNGGGPAPTTAVAMSILYSITGIVALLFVVIITTGAMRAHRNPARYGPRTAFNGRPRQSRAKGLARAMLETIPIVKFGDPEPAKPGSASARDVELENGTNNRTADATVASNINKQGKTEDSTNETTVAATPTPNVPGVGTASGMGAAQAAESVKSGSEEAARDGELECSICTENFTTGEDVRVLPCNHKYHPACIDPWLLNVSGTCPLCRHDLNPTATNTDENAEAAPANGELPPPLEVEAQPSVEDPSQRARRRASHLLHLHGLRSAPPDERIAALRLLREQSRAAGTASEDVEEPSRRERITNRLRDKFRVGTTRQGPRPAPPTEQPAASSETFAGAPFVVMRGV